MVSGVGVDMEEDRQDLLGWIFVQTVGRRGVFSQKFAISKCLPAGSIDFDQVLAYFNDNACAVPLVWVGASLILDSDSIANTEGCESSCVFAPSLLLNHVTVPQCLFT